MTDVERIAGELPQDGRAVMLGIGGDDMSNIPYVRDVADKIGLPIQRTRAAIRRLVDAKLCEGGPLFSDYDGKLLGFSFWYTRPLGRSVREHLQQENEQ